MVLFNLSLSILPTTDCKVQFFIFTWFNSAVQAHQLFRDEEWDTFKEMFETYMFEASKVSGALNRLDWMRMQIQAVVYPTYEPILFSVTT